MERHVCSTHFGGAKQIPSFKRHRTTAYGKQYRMLKVAFMAHNPSCARVLQLVLLGARTVLREELATNTAKLVYEGT